MPPTLPRHDRAKHASALCTLAKNDRESATVHRNRGWRGRPDHDAGPVQPASLRPGSRKHRWRRHNGRTNRKEWWSGTWETPWGWVVRSGWSADGDSPRGRPGQLERNG